VRANFEEVFSDYESRIQATTEAILRRPPQSLEDMANAVYTLFLTKMLNFVRNPYSVIKTLDAFRPLTEIRPTDPQVASNYERTLWGRRPQQAHLANTLGISDDKYEAWLRVIVLLMTPLKDGTPNLFEQALRAFYLDPRLRLEVQIHRYSSHRCLLSDRFSSPVPEDPHLFLEAECPLRGATRLLYRDC
jgi:hypothetical protein